MLNGWKLRISKAIESQVGLNGKIRLGDQGADLNFEDPSEMDQLKAVEPTIPNQYFIKFFGTSDDRKFKDFNVIEEIKRSACHKVLSYPKGKRPRQVRDGDLIFIGRLVRDPFDIMIIGRTIGIKYDPRIDNATQSDINLRKWRREWPHYIRINRPEFVKGRLGDRISLYRLMQELGSNIFASTYAHALEKDGNIDPRKAYIRQASVRLTPYAARIINERLDDLFSNFGRFTEEDLQGID